jgi:hypothetical protein
MAFIIGGYWDSIGLVTSFCPSDLYGSGTRFVVRSSTMIAITPVFSGGIGSTHRSIRFEPSR